MRMTLMALVAVLVSGCATQFWGAAKVKDGPVGCKATCDGWQMDLVGMVKMGEYSDGCICQVRPAFAPSAPAPAAPGSPATPSSDASRPQGGLAGLPAIAGVYVQMQAAAAAAAQQSAASRDATSHPGSSIGSPGRAGRF